MQPLEAKFRFAKHVLASRHYPGYNYICVTLDNVGLNSATGLHAYLGSLLGEVWNQRMPSERLGKFWTRGGQLKRIGFLIMCERACRHESKITRSGNHS